MRKVEVVSFNEGWSVMFEEEVRKMNTIFGNEIVAIYHIGSTSIPGMYAKPIIDILVEVKDIESVDHYNEQMSAIGYRAMGEHGISGRRFFCKGEDERTHHVHVFKTGSEHITRHLAFKEYMITHPKEAKAYSELKQRLAKQFPTDMKSYIEGKDPFIKETEKKALEWYSDHNV
ncbi:GrpB family protein [Thermaerobacillus caldiproteolyticus]|uniref:GrpB family protein n=1 Tax=Thermaerobacillus caldiproteolyticus TaxID=247480 RepID=UPI00188D6FCD|nr:GrpB family protein [Anoxybacillus caldiproteolyticus]QPA32782.1 GrpB family protein [Anoxybacillus caldiproteolyticus]